MSSSAETKQDTDITEQGKRDGCKSLSQELAKGKKMDGASAGRAVWINGYRRSWTAGWRSWSSASALSGRLPLGWTGSDPVLLGHLPGNNRALHLDHNQASTLPTDHLGLEADLGTLDHGKGKSVGRPLLCRLAQSLEAAGE